MHVFFKHNTKKLEIVVLKIFLVQHTLAPSFENIKSKKKHGKIKARKIQEKKTKSY